MNRSKRNHGIIWGMKATLIDGKKLAADTRAEIARDVAALKKDTGVTPGLAVILVGENPASISYVTAKEKACAEAGMYSREIRLPADTPESTILATIQTLNADSAIHGILVQLPLPKGISEKKVIDATAGKESVTTPTSAQARRSEMRSMRHIMTAETESSTSEKSRLKKGRL